MAKAISKSKMSEARKHALPGDNIVLADGEELNLRNRVLAAVLAWLIPGAGHFYQRRYLKSAIFSVCVFTTFLVGMFLAGGRCVYAAWNGTERRWQYALQAGAGLPTAPAAIQGWRSRNKQPPILGGFMAAPRGAGELNDWNRDTGSGFDMGTLYTMIAGLLNILVIFDAYAGPLPPPVPKHHNREGPADDDDDSAKTSPETATGNAEADGDPTTTPNATQQEN